MKCVAFCVWHIAAQQAFQDEARLAAMHARVICAEVKGVSFVQTLRPGVMMNARVGGHVASISKSTPQKPASGITGALQ
jgi:hypothetical protein